MHKLKAKVNKTIEKLVTWIRADGGDIELLDINPETKEVVIKVSGGCVDCDFFDQTFHHGVRDTILKNHPEVSAVNFKVHRDEAKRELADE
ncbi:MAG: NifU family protein [Mycoplasmataceae bacterium]|jgi:Fe-S cluster biogenesis protein NfuA|nr:NifU family protein [Mycoplasmataceae bacterium]